MSSNCGTRAAMSHGARVGPLFSTKDQCAFVKVSREDKKRAVLNMTSMTLVDYACRSEYPEGVLRSDPSLFVPIFCADCYHTDQEDYSEALADIVSHGCSRFLVGMCSVYGVAPGEVYPDARKEFLVGNDMSYSGACHPRPGKAVFLHDVKKDIGQVQCYWHVHSRSSDKTFLYCCVACRDDAYTSGILDQEDMSMGFSLGTVGDNEFGPITEECSLVSVPMRPGCFCTLVAQGDLARVMVRMGFSTHKNSILDASARAEYSDRCAAQKHTDVVVRDISQAEVSDRGLGVSETLAFLKQAALDSAARAQIFHDALEAIRVQNSVLTKRLTCPDDVDTLFTLRGAKEFTERTGIRNKLCAGVEPSRRDIDEVTEAPGMPSDLSPETVGLGDSMTQVHVDNLITLLMQQQQLLLQQQQQQQQQNKSQMQSTPEQQEQQSQVQALQAIMRLAPGVQPFSQHQPNASELCTQTHGQRQFGDGSQARQTVSGQSGPDAAVHPVYGALNQEQRRQIAMEYNKEESERQAASQREQEKMLSTFRSGIRDVLQEHWRSHSADHALQSVARDAPYNRTGTRAMTSEPEPRQIQDILTQLRELVKSIPSLSSESNSGQGDGVCTGEALAPMDTKGNDTGCLGSACAADEQESQPTLPGVVMTKQQAGYKVDIIPGDSDDLTDFIAAVAKKVA